MMNAECARALKETRSVLQECAADPPSDDHAGHRAAFASFDVAIGILQHKGGITADEANILASETVLAGIGDAL